jgi:hypothetical protein
VASNLLHPHQLDSVAAAKPSAATIRPPKPSPTLTHELPILAQLKPEFYTYGRMDSVSKMARSADSMMLRMPLISKWFAEVALLFTSWESEPTKQSMSN